MKSNSGTDLNCAKKILENSVNAFYDISDRNYTAFNLVYWSVLLTLQLRAF